MYAEIEFMPGVFAQLHEDKWTCSHSEWLKAVESRYPIIQDYLPLHVSTIENIKRISPEMEIRMNPDFVRKPDDPNAIY